MVVERWTGLQERESETLILDPLVLNDGQPSPTGLAVPGYQYRLPIQGDRWRCRSFVVVPREQFNPDVQGYLNQRILGYRNWLITLVSPTGDVLHRDIPLTVFLRNVNGLGLVGMQAFRMYFGDESYFDARQSYVTLVDPALPVTGFLVFRFVYA